MRYTHKTQLNITYPKTENNSFRSQYQRPHTETNSSGKEHRAESDYISDADAKDNAIADLTYCNTVKLSKNFVYIANEK
jgi:hypothetical protein